MKIRNILWVVLLLSTTVSGLQLSIAQSSTTFFSTSVGPSIGANNHAGSVGLEVEYLFTKHIALDAGIGYGPWGVVAGGQLRYYLNYPYGLSVFTGLTSGIGASDVIRTVRDTDTTLAKISVNLKPASSIDFGMGYAFQLGLTGRLHLRLGYAVGITDNLLGFKEPLLFTLRKEDVDGIESPAPGGIIFSLAYTYGFGNN